MVEAARLPEVERGARGVAEVLVGQLLAVVRRRASLALAAAVVVARELVDELRPVDQPAELEDVELRPLAVGQQHAHRLVLLHHRLELADGGRVVDHEARPHGLRELDHLPELRRGAREDREPARLAPIDAAAHERLDATQVVVHGSMAVGARPRASQHAFELVLDVLVAGQPPAVDIQVTGCDRGDVAPDPCELPDGGFGDDGHSTSRSRRVW